MTENDRATASFRFPSFFIPILILLIPQVMRRIETVIYA